MDLGKLTWKTPITTAVIRTLHPHLKVWVAESELLWAGEGLRASG